MSKPAIVVIPGAWHDTSSMATITSSLESSGYKVYARQMPAVGNPNPPKDLSEDIAAARALIEEAIGDGGNDVVVSPHSWGGVVVSSALEGYSKKEREAQGKKGGVIRTAYIAAFILPTGTSLMEAIGGQYTPWMDVEDPYIRATDPNIFYNDLPAAEQQHWASKLKTQAMGPMWAKTTAASWQTIPTSYLVCEDDLAIPVAAQEGMCKGVEEAGGEIEVTKIMAGHSPFLSKPEETVQWLRRVAGEKV
ncbi:hypothetical protein NX059_000475 [Plenodomus lindquistii]|nr:hypothetical protein NX059_000475 [Plenodomus lindquistii]